MYDYNIYYFRGEYNCSRDEGDVQEVGKGID